MLTIVPLVSRALRRFGLVEASYRRAATKVWQIEAPCEGVHLPTFYDEADLSRVTAAAGYTTVRFQVDRLAGTVSHGPRHAYLLENVVMVDGHLFKWGMVQPLASRPMPKVSMAPSVEVPEAVLASTENGNRFFGHWLCDDLPLALTARQWGHACGHIGADNTPSPHQAAYTALLRPDVRLLDNARFRRLVVFETAPESIHQAARYARLRHLLCDGRVPRRQAGVMLLRGDSGQRRVLVNEGAVAEMAAARGFSVLDPMACTVAEILDACVGARIVLGIEGSQLSHALYTMGSGGAFVTLQPPFKFDNFWKERCDGVGAAYAFVIGTTVGPGEFEVDVDQVARMIDRVERWQRDDDHALAGSAACAA